eukprot:5647214-Pyramimonas_sp.AAC.1
MADLLDPLDPAMDGTDRSFHKCRRSASLNGLLEWGRRSVRRPGLHGFLSMAEMRQTPRWQPALLVGSF